MTAGKTVALGVGADDMYSMILKQDGTLWAWGYAAYGPFGSTASQVLKLTPFKIMGGVMSIASAGDHTLVLQTDGTLWAWGNNDKGQIGDGTTTYRPTVVKVMTGVKAIAAGEDFSFAVKDDGTVWAWGDNWCGQMGDGQYSNHHRPSPVSVLTNVVSIAAGWSHGLAVEQDGTLWGWGCNNYGQLGNDVMGVERTPIPLERSSQQIDNVATVDASGSYSLAVTKDGGLMTWGGENNTPKPGFDHIIDMITTGVASASISDSYYYSHISLLALMDDGRLLANGNPLCGTPDSGVDSNTPQFTEVMTDVATMAAGWNHGVAVKSDGTVMQWGSLYTGKISDARPVYKCSGSVKVMSGAATSPIVDVSVVKATGVKASQSSLYLVKGKSATLRAAVQPYKASVGAMTFKSSNTSVAKVNTYTGKVTAGKKAAGKSTTITITSNDGKFKATVKVHVVSSTKKLKSLSITPGKASSLLAGQALRMKVKLNPAKATGIILTFSSSNTAVAVIDKAGVIRALTPGKTTITVKAGSKTKKFVLTVS